MPRSFSFYCPLAELVHASPALLYGQPLRREENLPKPLSNCMSIPPATPVHTHTYTHTNLHTQFTLMWVDLQDQYSWNTPNLAISGIFFPRMTSWCLSRVLLVLVCFVLDRSMWVPYLKLPWGSMCTLMDGLRWDGSGNEAGVGKKEKLELIDLPNLLRLGKKGHHVQFFSPSLFGK